MSIRISKQEKATYKPAESSAFTFAKGISTFFYGVAAISLLISISYLIYFIVTNQMTKPLLATHLQNILCSSVIVFVTYQIYQIVASCEDKERFFQAKQARRLRKISLVLALIVFTQIIVLTFFSAHGIDSQGVNMLSSSDILGFPDSTMWGYIFEKSDSIAKVEPTAPDTNYGLAIAALALWCLSYAFEKGLDLQKEQEETL